MNTSREYHPVSGRRAFLKTGGSLTAGLLAAGPGSGAEPLPPGSASVSMPMRNLGRTGFKVGIFGLGGQAALERPRNETVAVSIVERALDLGVNYVDTSSIYGGKDRWSERYIGQVMRRRRSEAFLASKTKERTRDDSLRRLDESLELLGTDHLDLWQLHDIGTAEDIQSVFANGGAVEALIRAREQKMVRYLGITGHYRPEALIEGIRRFPFDTVLMALSAADPHHFSFQKELLPLAVEKQLGVIAMKVPGRGRLLSSWTPPPIEAQQRSWEGAVIARTGGVLSMREAMYYALSLPISTAIIGCDSVRHLEENVEFARDFTPLSEQQMASMVERARPVSEQALFFRWVNRG